MNELAQARDALRRDRRSEALVFLWNAVEPARLAGDEGALRTLAGLAQRIARDGDEGERREAERLLEEVHGVAREEASVPATEQLGAEIAVGGETIADDRGGLDLPAETTEDEGEGQPPSRAARIMNLVWILLVLGVIALNVIRGGE